MSKADLLLGAAAALLQSAPNCRMNAVILNKALFYLDIAALRDTGKTVTENTYIALENGPVIAKYQKRLIDALSERGIAKQIDEWDGSKPIVLETPPAQTIENSELAALASKISQYFSQLTSARASLYSHENPGWKIAWDEYSDSGKPAPIDLQIAMQQIVEDDPWIHVPLTKTESVILDSADNFEGDDW